VQAYPLNYKEYMKKRKGSCHCEKMHAYRGSAYRNKLVIVWVQCSASQKSNFLAKHIAVKAGISASRMEKEPLTDCERGTTGYQWTNPWRGDSGNQTRQSKRSMWGEHKTQHVDPPRAYVQRHRTVSKKRRANTARQCASEKKGT